MKRRDFLKYSAPAIALPFAINGMSFRALAKNAGLQHIIADAERKDKVLVIVQLEGGNDGLNTIIPVDDDIYYNSRPTLAISKGSALPVSGEPLLRLHPELEGFRRLYDQGKLAIINNIGYSNYSLSHFQGMEIWNTGSGGGHNEYHASGWMGRLLGDDFPDYPSILPDHPPAIQIRPAVSSVFGIGSSTIGLALTDPATFYDLVNGGPNVLDDPAPDTLPGQEWNYIKTINTQAIQYAGVIREAAGKAHNIAEYPGGSELATSLAIIARLIAGGLETRVYMVSIGSFDTHGNQLPHHAALLGQLGSAVHAFMQDAAALGIADRVVGMTYSEFGRRIIENASGTDHGAAAPHFVFGASVDGGRIHGGPPDLANPDDHGNLRHEITFQCYYASVLGPLFHIPEERMRKILPVGLCDPSERVRLYHKQIVELDERPDLVDVERFSNSPNPASTETIIRYGTLVPGNVELTLHTLDGRMVTRLIDEYQDAGNHTLHVNVAGLPSGTYICRLRAENRTRSHRMVVER